MRLPVVSDRLLLLGEVSSLLSGELFSKIYLTVSQKEWTLASEHLAYNPLFNQYLVSFSDQAFDKLWFDSSLLISAWFIANIVNSDGVLGYMPRTSRAVYDQTISLLIATANIVLTTIFILCVAVNNSSSGAISVYDYEVLTAFSVSFLFAFRLGYSRRINTFI